MAVTAVALESFPEVRPGDELAPLIAERTDLRDDDVLVLAHKVVSKAEGRVRELANVAPSESARALAAELGKDDPRHLQVVLDETREILRAAGGVLISVTRHGFICANAGVDRSNVAGEDAVVMLPLDPDRSARQLRGRLAELTEQATRRPHHRLVRPGVASRPDRRGHRVRRTGAARGLAGSARRDRPRAERDLDRRRR